MDLTLIIWQTQKKLKTKYEKLLTYHAYLEKLTEQFKKISFSPLPREKRSSRMHWQHWPP